MKSKSSNSFLVALLLSASVVCFAFAGYINFKSSFSSSSPRMVRALPVAPVVETKITPIIQNNPSEVKLEVIELNEDNMIVLDQAFDDSSVTKVMQDLQKLSEKLPEDSTVYLVLNSPGGSVPAGQLLISFIKGLPLKVKTLSIFSASMAFQTVQSLDERLILDSGSLMSHRAKFGVQGEGPGEIFSRLKWIMSMVDSLDANAAQRMGMSFDEYRNLIADEYWVFGQNAVKDKAADRAVFAKCAKNLSGVREVTVETMFGPFEVTVSKCPLLPGALSIKAMAPQTPDTNKGLEYVKQMFTDRNQFVRDFIMTNKYEEYLKRK